MQVITAESTTNVVAIIQAAARPRLPGEPETMVRRADLRTARDGTLVDEFATATGATKREAGSADACELREGEPVVLLGDDEFVFLFDSAS